MARSPNGYWTLNRCKVEANNYRTRKEWQTHHGKTYQSAHKNGWLDECCGHMVELQKPNGYWTLGRCKTEAGKYKTRSDWKINHEVSYVIARRDGWFDECSAHMTGGYKPRGYWSKERCYVEAQKYPTSSEWFYHHQVSYATAQKNGWLDECCAHMLEKRFIAQEEARDIFERIFQIRFKESRPKFLKRLSLDGYNNNVIVGKKRVKLAFEYDGEFHDRAHPKSKDPENDLKASKARDRLKDELCAKNGIILIRIHYSDKRKLEETILKELKTRNLMPGTFTAFPGA